MAVLSANLRLRYCEFYEFPDHTKKKQIITFVQAIREFRLFHKSTKTSPKNKNYIEINLDLFT